MWIFWNLFTLIGALAGQHIADPGAWGLDGAAAAAFLALLWPRLASRDLVALAVAAGFVATITTPMLPAGLPVLAAAAVAVVVGLVGASRAHPARAAEGEPGAPEERPATAEDER